MEAQPKPPVTIRPEVAAYPPYRQGAVPVKPGFKLSSNENPFPTHEKIRQAIAGASVSRYAGQGMSDIKKRIGEKFGLAGEDALARVHLGAGSVSILYQLVHAVAGVGDEVVYPWPSFEAYPLLGIASGATAVPVALTADAEHDFDAMADAITDKTRAVLLCSPNNPTGPAIKEDEFCSFMKRVPENTLVILDEAYREFVTQEDAVKGEEVVAGYDNLVVLRTFSKVYGLASVRLGYGIGHPLIWDAANVTGIPLSLTGQAEAAVSVALEPEVEDEIFAQARELIARREQLLTGLRDLGYRVADTQGNYVWLMLGEKSAALGDLFMSEGTLVRVFPGLGVRVTIGEEESIPEVLRIAELFLNESGA